MQVTALVQVDHVVGAAVGVEVERQLDRDHAGQRSTRGQRAHLVQPDVDGGRQVDAADAVPAGVQRHRVAAAGELADLADSDAQRAAEGAVRADQGDDVGDPHQRSVAFTRASAGTSRVTTALAPTTAARPTVTPRSTRACAATQAPSSTVMGPLSYSKDGERAS